MQLSAEQAYIAGAAEFYFCADFNRHKQIVPDAKTGFVEQLLIGATDAAMMGQNALVAAESPWALSLRGIYWCGTKSSGRNRRIIRFAGTGYSSFLVWFRVIQHKIRRLNLVYLARIGCS